MTGIERVLQSRALHRAVNDRIAELTKQFALNPASDPPMIVFCECGREGCMTPVELTISEYEAVRVGAGRWVVSSDHIDEAADSTLARRNGYALVEHLRLSTEAPVPRKESLRSPQTADSSPH